MERASKGGGEGGKLDLKKVTVNDESNLDSCLNRSTNIYTARSMNAW